MLQYERLTLCRPSAKNLDNEHTKKMIKIKIRIIIKGKKEKERKKLILLISLDCLIPEGSNQIIINNSILFRGLYLGIVFGIKT